MPKSRFQTAEAQVADLGQVYYRRLRPDDICIPSSESYLVPRAEAAQMNSALLTVPEVCAILKCHKATVHAMIQKGLLSAAKLDPDAIRSPWRIRRSSLARYLDDDLIGDHERNILGRPPRQLGSVDTQMSASGGAMLGTATVVTENEAVESWEKEDADEEQAEDEE